ncbi:MAG TPA: RebB family R body protein [Rhizomicrobium sp.]|jgi:hypothetical protein
MAGENEQAGDPDARRQSRGGATNDPNAPNNAPPNNAGDSLADAVRGLSGLYTAEGGTGVTPAVTDAVTQVLVMLLGSGPALAAYDGLLQAQQANGIMYHNAVANQQKATMLGMALTAKCVRYMMNPHDNGLDDALEEELDAL